MKSVSNFLKRDFQHRMYEEAYCQIGKLAHLTDEPSIRATVQRYLPESQFRRVWIYEGLLRRVALSIP